MMLRGLTAGLALVLAAAFAPSGALAAPPDPCHLIPVAGSSVLVQSSDLYFKATWQAMANCPGKPLNGKLVHVSQDTKLERHGIEASGPTRIVISSEGFEGEDFVGHTKVQHAALKGGPAADGGPEAILVASTFGRGVHGGGLTIAFAEQITVALPAVQVTAINPGIIAVSHE
jgi:hypothetical protein